MKRICLLATLAVLLGATPAWAHEEINPSTFPVGKPAFLTITAANEKAVKLTRLTLNAPAGLNFGSTLRSPAGWASTRTDTVITWSGGTVETDHFESFGFEIEGADQPGTLTYKATLTYADASNDDVSVPVTVLAAGATSAGSGSGSSRANAALGLAGAALALAVVSLALGRRRGSAGPSTPAQAGAEQDW